MDEYYEISEDTSIPYSIQDVIFVHLTDLDDRLQLLEEQMVRILEHFNLDILE